MHKLQLGNMQLWRAQAYAMICVELQASISCICVGVFVPPDNTLRSLEQISVFISYAPVEGIINMLIKGHQHIWHIT
jgi:hypothetical protein